MSFNYEQSIWGRGEAGLKWSDPASFRLRAALQALSGLPANAKILEVGCGAGQFISALKKMRPQWDCYGADISEQAVVGARARLDGVCYNIAQENSLPYAHDFFDAVLVFDVLEHVSDPRLFVDQIYRVLKPNGLLYAYVPCEGSCLSLWYWLRRLKFSAAHWTKNYAGHINYFSRHSLLNLMTLFNFRIKKIRYSEHFFGQILSFMAFYLLHRAARAHPGKQINNEEYFSRHFQSHGLTGKIKKFINSLVYFESLLFSVVPSPNVHLTVIKK